VGYGGSVNSVSLPTYRDLLWPTLRAVREMGDSGTIEEIVEKVAGQEGFTWGDGVEHNSQAEVSFERLILDHVTTLPKSDGEKPFVCFD
jgi:hypothetical protein